MLRQPTGTVLVFEHNFALEAAIRSQTYWYDASMRVTNSKLLGCFFSLLFGTMNYAQTLKGYPDEHRLPFAEV
jgi:hypothetical protein